VVGVNVPIYKKGDETDCSNYRGIPFLSTTYKILSNIFLLGLTPYAEDATDNHQCGFQCKTSTTDHIPCTQTNKQTNKHALQKTIFYF
jgi:hypothetical protein